ncbi:hypothetical protein MRB53_038709 [Persea americana]|nr:hypothetical protein MRB53_038709 [Persea americana]
MDAPLLRSSIASYQTSRPARSKQSRSMLGRILAKIQATPRSEAIEGHEHSSERTVRVGGNSSVRFPPNAVSNAKYTPWSFLPRTLYNEFSFFFNMYFLLVALSQIIKPLRIGYLSTYVAPLAFVLAITLGKEAIDDISRRRRDAEANSERYEVLKFERMPPMEQKTEQPSGSLQRLESTVEASSDVGGEAFIRTDQLDGETDWKLRLAVPLAQNCPMSKLNTLELTAGRPDKAVNEFLGAIGLRASKQAALSIDNTAWANTVVASNNVILAVIVYTGPQTRQALSTSASRTKTGLLEHEINALTKILCALTLCLSLILVALEGFEGHAGAEMVYSRHAVLDPLLHDCPNQSPCQFGHGKDRICLVSYNMTRTSLRQWCERARFPKISDESNTC